MPYEQRTSAANIAQNHKDLVNAVSSEFTKPTSPTPHEAGFGLEYRSPHIIEGTIRNTDRLEVYVVWDGWSAVPEEHRVNAILDAYRQGPDPQKAQRIVIALGLTPEEARNLGVINRRHA